MAILAAILIPIMIAAIAGAVDFSFSIASKTKLDGYALSAAQTAVNIARQSYCSSSQTSADQTTAITAGKTAASTLFTQAANGLSRTSASITTTGSVNTSTSPATLSFSTTYSASYTTIFGVKLNISNINLQGSASASMVCTSSTPTASGTNPNLGTGELIHEPFLGNYLTYNGTIPTGYTNYDGWVINQSSFTPETTYTGPDKTGRFVDLDGAASNVTLSYPINLPVGTYELRYWYVSRIIMPAPTPGYICATADADLAFDTSDTNVPAATTQLAYYNKIGRYGGLTSSVAVNAYYPPQTNRLNVYLDPITSTTPPLSFSPATNNMIDGCSYSSYWIQRSVKITVNQASSYWLTFSGEGAHDNYGAVISTIQLCQNTCSGSVSDPYAWLWSNTPGYYTVLFNDSFKPATTYSFSSPYGGSLWPGGLNTASNGSGVIGSTYIYATGGGYEIGSIPSGGGTISLYNANMYNGPINLTPNTGILMAKISDATSAYATGMFGPYSLYRPPAWLVWPSDVISVDRSAVFGLGNGIYGTDVSGLGSQYANVGYLIMASTPTNFTSLYSVPGLNSFQTHISKKLFLEPGYYSFHYGYDPRYEPTSVKTSYCGTGSQSSLIQSVNGLSTSSISYWTANSQFTWDINAVAVFIDNDQTVLTPIQVGTGTRDYGGQSLTYNLYGGSSLSGWTTPNYVSSTTYLSYPVTGVTNLLPQNNIHRCLITAGEAAPTINFLVAKAGYYWFTIAGESGNTTGGPGPGSSALQTTINGKTYYSSTSPYGGGIDYVGVWSTGGLTMNTSSLSPAPITLPYTGPTIGSLKTFSGTGYSFSVTVQ